MAVSEGIHYGDGTFVSEAKTSATDGFGHAQLGGLAALLLSYAAGYEYVDRWPGVWGGERVLRLGAPECWCLWCCIP